MAHPNAARSPIFAFADQYVDERARLDPLFGTEIGLHEVDHLLPDFSSVQVLRRSAHTLDALTRLDGFAPGDDLDRVAQIVMHERLAVDYELDVSGETQRTWGVLASPLSTIRQAFELMDADNAAAAEVIRSRLGEVRGSLQSWRHALDDDRAARRLPSRRHVLGVADQARTYSEGTYAALARRVAKSASVDATASGLAEAAKDADLTCAELGEWLRTSIAPHASEDDRCGPERFQRWFRYYNGTGLDVDELYAWGWQDLKRIRDRMWVLGEELAPGSTSLDQVVDVLERDERRAIYGSDALLERLVSFTEATVSSLEGVHFDIDPRIRRCDARIAPLGSAAAPYYIPPSEDLARPGTTWFPTLGADRFSWWRYVSTWYHEAVPGHHLQCAVTILNADRLSRFHRLAAWTSGYGEGWALYAERLMDELGGYADAGDELGHLQGQALRAARIVVDLGLHLSLAAPQDLGVLGELGDCSGAVWTRDMAIALVHDWALEDHDYAVSEVDRYLSLPAQATSYKVGERVWLEVREAARERLGDGFELKRFHAHALALGPMGLDPFRAQMAIWDGR